MSKHQKHLTVGRIKYVLGCFVIAAYFAQSGVVLMLKGTSKFLPAQLAWPPIVYAGMTVCLSIMMALLSFRRLFRMQQESTGKLYLGVIAWGSLGLVLVGLLQCGLLQTNPAPSSALLSFGFEAQGSTLGSGSGGTLEAIENQVGYALRPLPETLQAGLGITVFLVVILFCLWKLTSNVFRKWVWILIDAWLLTGFCSLLTFTFRVWNIPFPEIDTNNSNHVQVGSALVGAGIFLGIRLFVRLFTPMIKWFEGWGTSSLLAGRLLRAKKSGFLNVIGVLSILAVSVACMTLSTTLSVMAGFKEDLRNKILGNRAHLIIDRNDQNFDQFSEVYQTVRNTKGIKGAAAYLESEVMISATSNMAGGLLRGINPKELAGVSDLESNLTAGKLAYLEKPEMLLNLSLDEIRGKTAVTSPFAPSLPQAQSSKTQSSKTQSSKAQLPKTQPIKNGDQKNSGLSHAITDAVKAAITAPSVPHLQEPNHSFTEKLSDFDDDAFESSSMFKRKHDPTANTHLSNTQQRRVMPGIIIGQELAHALHLHLGDDISVISPYGDLGPSGPMPKSRPFRVAGIFYSGLYEYDMKTVYMKLEEAQKFLSLPGNITGIEAKIENADDATEMQSLLQAKLKALHHPPRVRTWQEVNKNLFGALALEKLAMFLTLGIAVLIASFCIFSTLTLSVQEKSKQIGILKTYGAPESMIMRVFLLEGLLIGIIGAISGLALGYAACFAGHHLGIIKLNPEVYYIDQLPIHIEPMEFLWIGIAAIVVSVIATLYPAKLASKQHPIDALFDR